MDLVLKFSTAQLGYKLSCVKIMANIKRVDDWERIGDEIILGALVNIASLIGHWSNQNRKNTVTDNR